MIQLSERDLAQLRKRITDYSGLAASVQTDDALTQAVARRLAAHRLASLSEYWPLLQGKATPNGEMNNLVRLLTNKETYFFREMHHFEALVNRVLPELLAARRRSLGVERGSPLRIWSAGCATGEEAYTLAIILLEYQARHGKFPVEIIATDIDAVALETARQGCYGPRSVRHVPEVLRHRYFTAEGQTLCILPEVAELVTFQIHNLAEACCPPGLVDLDVIFCRNLTIYFDDEARERLNVRLADSLLEGGYLFVASAETMGHNRGRLELISLGDTFLFRKGVALTAPAPEPSSPDWTETGPSILDRLARAKSQTQTFTRRVPAWVEQELRAQPWRPQPATVPEPPALTPTPGPLASGPLLLLDRAQSAFLHHDFDAALRELDRLPQGIVWIDAYRLRGAIMLQLERLEEAEAACQTVLAHDPWHADAHFLLGLIFRQQGQTDAAIRSLRQAVYLEPSHRHAHFYLAEIYRAEGSTDMARREYENTLNILAHLPNQEPVLNLTGLEDNFVRQACEANLRNLQGRRRATTSRKQPSSPEPTRPGGRALSLGHSPPRRNKA